MTESVQPDVDRDDERPQRSLSTAAARNLATTTKSEPQMRGITSRWLLRILPWVTVSGGTYRVNQRLTYTIGDGRITVSNLGSEARVIPPELAELSLLRGFTDSAVLEALADQFTRTDYNPGDLITELGQPDEHLHVIAHGRVRQLGSGMYDEQAELAVLADGDYFGEHALVGEPTGWEFTARAETACTVMSLSRAAFDEVVERSEALRAHLAANLGRAEPASNKYGEAAIELASGHSGEPTLPGTFVDYELAPREYELSVAQTVLRVHTRVADLYNQPMNQVEQQLRLTIEALRERQEHELVNNAEFGLLRNADFGQRIPTRTGPPTPDDLDELLSRRRKSKYFLAHPRAIAAFGQECNRRGLYPQSVDIDGHMVPSWRGVPLLPCNKIPITSARTTSIMVLRTGEADQGVIGLHQPGIPDEYQPSLSVRFMGIDDQAIMSYLVSAYYSAAILVPDALGVLENVELGRAH